MPNELTLTVQCVCVAHARACMCIRWAPLLKEKPFPFLTNPILGSTLKGFLPPRTTYWQSQRGGNNSCTVQQLELTIAHWYNMSIVLHVQIPWYVHTRWQINESKVKHVKQTWPMNQNIVLYSKVMNTFSHTMKSKWIPTATVTLPPSILQSILESMYYSMHTALSYSQTFHTGWSGLPSLNLCTSSINFACCWCDFLCLSLWLPFTSLPVFRDTRWPSPIFASIVQGAAGAWISWIWPTTYIVTIDINFRCMQGIYLYSSHYVDTNYTLDYWSQLFHIQATTSYWTFTTNTHLQYFHQ